MLTGKESSRNFPIVQVHNISMDCSLVPESMDLVDLEDKTSKSDVEALLAADPIEIHPTVTQKEKKESKRKSPADMPSISGPLPNPISM